ncbi:MAG: exodeoxyribonuclease V subunit beta [Myxococcales bacterium]|jgi:exodeoxyribonuclease V beta subunit
MNAVSPELTPLESPTLVEASAGTGKTHTITTYFVRGILERGLRPEQILVVTYTKAATAELRIRCRTRIVQALALLDGPPKEPDVLHEVVRQAVTRFGRSRVEDRLRSALAEMDQTSILTIHGFCQRLLQDHPLLFGIDFDFEVAEDLSTMHAELAVDFWATDLYDRPPWLLRVLAKHGVGVEFLTKLANAAAVPGVDVVGPPEPSGSIEAAVSRAEARQAEAAAIWAANRSAISAILHDDPGLSRNVYRRGTIEAKWLPALDELFAKHGLQLLPDFVTKLAAGRFKVKRGYEEPRHAFFDACRRLCEAHEALEPFLEYEEFRFKRRFLEYVRHHAERRQRESSVFSFDDLLTTVHGPWSDAAGHDDGIDAALIAKTISLTYPLALVDEFQDTDSLQYGIFKAIYGHGSVVYVGDPKQAIYAFRGADVFSYIDAANDVGNRDHALRTNRRSDPALVRAVNTLFDWRPKPFVLDGIQFEPAAPHEKSNRSSLSPALELIVPRPTQLQAPLESAVAPIVANEIAHLLTGNDSILGRPIEPEDIAVLCRSNKQAVAVTSALRAFGIPTSLDGDSSVLNTEIASDLRAVLEAALMPGDAPILRRALLTSLLGVLPHELSTMKDEPWSAWVSKLREWNATWHGQGVLRFVEDMLRDTGAERRLATRPSARRELTDLTHLEELLVRGERWAKRDPIALMQWFRRLDEETPDQGAVRSEDLQQRPDAESGAVRVSTIHKAKGLEFSVVYCPFTWNDAALRGFSRVAVKYHDSEGRIRVDLGSELREEHLRQGERESLSEAVRLIYVAVTRAKHRCVLFWGQASHWKRSALAHLLHDDQRLDDLDEDAMRDDLTALANASGGTIGWREPNARTASTFEEETEGPELSIRQPTRSFEQAARIASFTSLTGSDEKLPSSRNDVQGAMAEPPLFAELPGGTRTGLLLHEILEQTNFSELESPQARGFIADRLHSHGLDPTLADAVQRDLTMVASTPLMPGKEAPRLIDLSREKQLRELEFTLHADRAEIGKLASILQAHAAPRTAPQYYQRLTEISAKMLHQFLRGFVDLVFEWQGQWYVADYKSNTLGSYGSPAITEAVQREHYILQGLLYTAAAQRHLKQRLPQYCAADWGGVLFLFLRGMRGAQGRRSTFFDRQSPELLEALDRWLGGLNGSR